MQGLGTHRAVWFSSGESNGNEDGNSNGIYYLSHLLRVYTGCVEALKWLAFVYIRGSQT